MTELDDWTPDQTKRVLAALDLHALGPRHRNDRHEDSCSLACGYDGGTCGKYAGGRRAAKHRADVPVDSCRIWQAGFDCSTHSEGRLRSNEGRHRAEVAA